MPQLSHTHAFSLLKKNAAKTIKSPSNVPIGKNIININAAIAIIKSDDLRRVSSDIVPLHILQWGICLVSNN
jgi:hypothetical protein